MSPPYKLSFYILLKVLIGVLLGGNPLVCWHVPSILCCFGPQREAWIDCMHHCCKYPIC